MPGEMEARTAYRHFLSLETRWMDNDVYGHVNNVVYYSYFDTVINRYLIERGGLDIARDSTVGLCVESHCAYTRPIAFPQTVEAGLRVAHVGRSSVRYEIGIFARGESEASAHGWFVHVFVDRATRRPAPIPPRIREALEELTAPFR
jgi:acyl-CoA thioester hydrolase